MNGSDAPRPLRILFLAPQPFFEVRGTPLAVRAMLRALTSLGHCIDLLSYPQGSKLQIHGVRHSRSLGLPVGRVPAGASYAKLLLDVPFMLQAWWRMLRGGYDVVHAVEEAAHLAAPLARLIRLPLVCDVDSSIPDQLRYSGFARRGPLLWAARRLESEALNGAVGVITVCESLTVGVRRAAPQTPVFQIEDPPLIEAGATADLARVTALRSELELGAEPVAFYSGNFESYQGVHLLVDAAAECQGVRFLFVGGEPAEIDTLEDRATALGVADRCVFAGKRPPELLLELLALSDVLVSPRLKGENTPFKLYTYLASGKPIVATAITTHTQLLDESLAFLAEPTPASLAGAIRRALVEPALARSLAARGVALIEREFSAKRYAEKVAAAYAAIGSALDRPAYG